MIVLWLVFKPPSRFSMLTEGIDWFDVILLVVLAGYLGFFEGDLKGGILSPAATVTLNTKERFVQVDYIRIYGKRTERFYFHQLKKFRSRKKDRWFFSEYCMDLILISGKRVSLNLPIGREKNEVVVLIKRLNKAIRAIRTQG